MVKYMKLVALAACCGCAAYVLGSVIDGGHQGAEKDRTLQVRPVKVAGPKESSAKQAENPAKHGTAWARKTGTVPAASLFDQMSHIQRALDSHIIFESQSVRDIMPDEAGKNEAILSMNYLMVMLLNPTQKQLRFEEIQLDRYQPSPSAWDKVRSAPTYGNAILHVTPDQQRYFEKWAAERLEEQRKAGAPVAHLPLEERVRYFRERSAAKPVSQHRAEWKARLVREQKQILNILTPAQRKEWDRIMSETRRELSRLTRTATASR